MTEHVLARAAQEVGGRRLVRPVQLLHTWLFRRRFRAELQRLSGLGPYLLDDIGLSVEKADKEASKPFWVP